MVADGYFLADGFWRQMVLAVADGFLSEGFKLLYM
jgi:hypothetical protein